MIGTVHKQAEDDNELAEQIKTAGGQGFRDDPAAGRPIVEIHFYIESKTKNLKEIGRILLKLPRLRGLHRFHLGGGAVTDRHHQRANPHCGCGTGAESR